MTTIRNLPLWTKSLLAPAIVLLAMFTMAGMAFSNLSSQAEDLRRLDQTAFERLREAMTVTDALTSFHAGLYHLTASAANETDKAKIETTAKKLASNLSSVEAALKQMEARQADSTGATGLKPVADAFAKYGSTALQVIDMTKVDAAYGVMMMGDAEQQFEHLRQLLKQVTDRAQQNRSDMVAQLLAGMSQMRYGFALFLALGTIISAAAALLISRLISGPAVRLTAVMGILASGDTSIAVPDQNQHDEIGAMARAVQVFKESAIERARLEAAQVEEHAAKEQRTLHMERLTRNFEAKVGQLVEALSSAATEMQSTAQSMSATADQTNQQSITVAAAAEQASANVQTVATAAEELSSSISEIGRQVAQSSEIAGHAVEQAKRTDATVQALASGAQKIGDVVMLIQDIASQTNLLALNATIEAARAGEAGKGFAVVASEVKSLANQTAKATDEISSQIAQIQGTTNDAVQAIRGIGTVIAEISQIAATIAAAIEEQNAATQEIARNVQQAAHGTQEVTGNIAGVKEAATTTGTAAAQVLGAASELSKRAEQLTAEVDEFLAGVKAA